MKFIKSILVAVLFATGCGGVPDTSDIDTHVLKVTLSELPDGTTSREVRDMGFDRDAYLTAVAETEDNLGQGMSIGEYGQSKQALTVSGRYGIDSQANQAGTESRCPNNPPYTGCASCNPGGNYCEAALSKSNKYFVDPTVTAWNTRFGIDLTGVFRGALADDMVGTSWANAQMTTRAAAQYVLEDFSGQCNGGAACVLGELSPITIAAGTGSRMRKRKIDADGMAGYVVTDMAFMYGGFNMLNDSMTVAQRSAKMRVVYRHEVGHMMGLGHRPVFVNASGISEPRNTMALNAGLSGVYDFTSDQKSELTGYVP